MQPGVGTVMISVLIALLGTPSAHAAKFTNQFVQFELPAQWECSLEGAEWVCQNTQKEKKREAIVVLAAKIKGDQDSLDQYLAYLKEPKTFQNVQNATVTSKPSYSKYITLNGHTWVDSLHQDSEIPGFYTRYFATVKQDIGVLVTYSVNKDKYKDYINDFEAMVKTLVVFRKPGAINTMPGNQSLFQGAQIPENVSVGSVFPNMEEPPKPAESPSSGLPLPVILIGAAIIAYLLIKRRRR